MFSVRSVFLLICASLVVPVYAQEGKLVIVDTTSKELKRSAHRLRILPEQLKNARQVLQEATDLARKMDPVPYSQYSNLANMWTQLNPSKAKAVIQSIVDDLRSAAQKAPDLQSYQRATSAGLSLLSQIYPQNNDRALEEIRRWPAPPASVGNAGQDYLKNLEKRIQVPIISRLAASDPEKALTLLSQQGDDGMPYSYQIRGQIAQSLMNSGKRDQALSLVDETMSYYAQHAGDPGLSQEYESFLRSAMPVLDTQRTVAALGQLIAQTGPDSCKGTLKVGDKTVELTCGESRAINLLHYPSKPSMTLKALESFPELKSKLDSAGGADVLLPGSMGTAPVQFSSPTGGWGMGSPVMTDATSIYQELRGKIESDPAFVKGKLREMAKGPEDIDKLISLAQRVAYEDPELGSLALEFAKSLLPLVEPIQKRSMTLQNLVRAYRQVDGEADTSVLRDGFILADQIRREQKQRNLLAVSAVMPPAAMPLNVAPVLVMPGGNTAADQLEGFLASELARDNFDSAIRYVRSMPDDPLKLTCLVQIVQALRQQNY